MIMRIVPIVILSLLPFLSHAQEEMSLQKAVEIALKNNYSITIAKNNNQINQNNNSAGNAGMLPNVSLSGSDNVTIANTSQQLFTGELREKKNARTDNLAAGIALNWTVFDGFGMFIEKKRLTELESQGEAQARLTISGTVADVITTYTAIVQQQRMLTALTEVLSISKERKFIADEKFKIGSGSELELLKAKVDFNTDSVSMIKQKITINQSIAHLGEMLAVDSMGRYRLSEQEILINEGLQIQSLLEKIQRQNPELSIAEKNIAITELRLKEMQAARLPRVSVNTGYTYSRQESQIGLLQSNRNNGLNYGISASFTLFDGLNMNRKVKNTRLELNNAEAQKKDTELRVKTETSRIFQEYQNSLSLIGIEKENIQVAKKNADVSLEKYRLGGISSIELRDAQRNLLDAQNRLFTELYLAKSAETELLRLSGQL